MGTGDQQKGEEMSDTKALETFVAYHYPDCIYSKKSEAALHRIFGKRCTCGRDEAAAELIELKKWHDIALTQSEAIVRLNAKIEKLHAELEEARKILGDVADFKLGMSYMAKIWLADHPKDGDK
jgi:5'-deoxynucleotidase YfbR-like HD superfamily hydrolase